MKIGVLGTGNVGNTIAAKLIQLGHEVKMGARTAGNSKALAFMSAHGPLASEGSFAEAAAFGEIVFNCTKGEHSIEALKLAGEETLQDKILVDVTNPLDSSAGMPATLLISNTNSLGEEIQRTFPRTKVVKTLNTMWCGLMVNPRMMPESHTVFVCGNDEEAKLKVGKLLQEFGWYPDEIFDLGDITNSRGTESYLPLWLRMYMKTKSGAFNIKIVKAES